MAKYCKGQTDGNIHYEHPSTRAQPANTTGEYVERKKKKNIIFRFSLKMEYNIFSNGISLNILGNMILDSIWASRRNIHIRIPHVGS